MQCGPNLPLYNIQSILACTSYQVFAYLAVCQAVGGLPCDNVSNYKLNTPCLELDRNYFEDHTFKGISVGAYVVIYFFILLKATFLNKKTSEHLLF